MSEDRQDGQLPVAQERRPLATPTPLGVSTAKLATVAGLVLLIGFLGYMVWKENRPAPAMEAPAAAVQPGPPPRDDTASLRVGEEASLAGGWAKLRLEKIDPAGVSATVLINDHASEQIGRGATVQVGSGSQLCDLTLTEFAEERATLRASCVPVPVQVEPLPVIESEEVRVTSNSVARFARGTLEVAVSMISPSRGALRVRINGGQLETLEQDLPATVYVEGDVCSVMFFGASEGVGRIGAACMGETGRVIGAERELAQALAPHRVTRLATGQTASFLDETLEVYLSTVDTRQRTARLSVSGGVLEPVAKGGVKLASLDGVPCAITVREVMAEGADLAVACAGRTVAPPVIISGAKGAANSVRSVLLPNRKALLLGERVRVQLSMISPDGQAARWSINEAGLTTTEKGDKAEFRVGAGTCTLTFLRVDGPGARVKGACDDAAMASRLLVSAAEQVAELVPNRPARLLDGTLKVRLSMIAPDGEAIRLSVNDGDLRTLERGAVDTFDYGAGLCSLDYAGRGPSGAATLRAACDRAALASDVLVPEAVERVTLAPGDEIRLLQGRLLIKLSMISPDGQAIRFAANGGPLATAELGRAVRFASGDGRCELTFVAREGTRARLLGACDTEAMGGAAFVPARSELVDLQPGRPTRFMSDRLTLLLSMVSPDRDAVRVAVNEAGLMTLERGRPIALPVGRGSCQLAYTGYRSGGPGLEATCDAGAFERAPLAEDARAMVDLAYRQPVRLFDGRLELGLSMISPRGDALRVSLNGDLATLEQGAPRAVALDGRDCALTYDQRVAGDRARVVVDCGSRAQAAGGSLPQEPETVKVATGATVDLFGGATQLSLAMISPSRTGLRVSLDGEKVRSLDRGEPITIDLAGQSCRIDYLGTDRGGPVEQALIATTCQ